VRVVETHLQVELSATATLRHEPAALHAAIDRVLEQVQREGPRADELAIGKSLLIASLNSAFEPLLARARLLAEWRSPGRPDDLYDPRRETERVRGIDLDALRAAAQRHLSRERRIVVYTTRATEVDGAANVRSKEGAAQAVVEGELR
jgi:rhodanese-related sulfurtransferase